MKKHLNTPIRVRDTKVKHVEQRQESINERFKELHVYSSIDKKLVVTPPNKKSRNSMKNHYTNSLNKVSPLVSQKSTKT